MSRLRLVEEDLDILSKFWDIVSMQGVLLGVQCTMLQEKGTGVVKFPVTVTVVKS